MVAFCGLMWLSINLIHILTNLNSHSAVSKRCFWEFLLPNFCLILVIYVVHRLSQNDTPTTLAQPLFVFALNFPKNFLAYIIDFMVY